MNTEVASTSDNAKPAPTGAQRTTPKRTTRRPGQTLACGWCGSPILLSARGRIPKWCSSSCRHRAWELTRPAAAGRAAVQVVDRVVEVDRPSQCATASRLNWSPRRAWPHALAHIAEQIDTGRVYDRDLPALAPALSDVMLALIRRPAWRRQHAS
jgi:hypothetical protein